MRRRSRKYLLLVVFLLFLSSYISSSFVFAYLREVYFPEFFDNIRKFIFPDDISCYRANGSLTNDIYAPNSIFFYQTTCRRAITLREACSIETVARLHPNKKVYLILLNFIPSTDPVVQEIKSLPNVEISRVSIETFADGMPFSDLRDVINKIERHNIMADLLKIITLYKFGGTVLDLDVVVTKSLNNLGDHWFVKDNDFTMSTMKLTNDAIGRAAAGMILRNLKKQADQGNMNGKKAVLDSLGELCSVSNAELMNNSTCSGFNIYDAKIFQPISYWHSGSYLKPGDLCDCYGYKTWLGNIKAVPKDSLYSTIARTYCPEIFTEFMYRFVSDY